MARDSHKMNPPSSITGKVWNGLIYLGKNDVSQRTDQLGWVSYLAKLLRSGVHVALHVDLLHWNVQMGDHHLHGSTVGRDARSVKLDWFHGSRSF